MSDASPVVSHFIRNLIEAEREEDPKRPVVTRFPPEPNGYLHIGHAKSICLNFGLARDFNGRCHLRLDDTNPEKEELEYVRSIQESVRWLGFDWGDHEYYASDYFDRCYEFALGLIDQGLAYVDSLSPEDIRAYRGNLTEPGRESPYRSRSPMENRTMFEAMRNGHYPDGAHVLRLKIDMSAPNMNLRDPTIYRIRRAHHWRTGDQWCIYPLYDYAHAVSDALEQITHSLCSLEFEDHRPLYDWVVAHTPVPSKPRQIEFARLNLSYTVMSKRKLFQLVDEGHVSGWDDPRMPTLMGLRRRGYTPSAIRTFCDLIGVSKAYSVIGIEVLEDCLRRDLNDTALRRVAVLDPLPLTLTNVPDEFCEPCTAPNHPQREDWGTRTFHCTKELWIERDDFMAEPVKGFFRLAPGQEVRLRYAYVIRCTGFDRDETGRITRVFAEVDLNTKSGTPGADAKKVKGNIHWLPVPQSWSGAVRLFDRLFTEPNPGALDDFVTVLNPNSISTQPSAQFEESLADLTPETTVQFERIGYFCVDRDRDSRGKPIFNRAVTLRDSFPSAR